MTPLQREALQMCLEYIETDAHERRHVRWKINEALAQPQQEPVLTFYEQEWQGKTSRAYQWLIDPFSLPAGTKLYTSPPAQPQQEPVDFASLLREAEEIVQGKPTWNRFIDATPLANDIAVWMTVFAQDVARRDAPLPSQPLTDEEIKQFASKHLDVGDGSYATHFVTGDVAFARAIEAAHGIKGDA